MKKLPIVAIVGRTNVGKSSIFNKVLKQPRSVVAREEGTTRDAITELVRLGGHGFWLVDTAGLKEAEDDFEATIQEQVTEAVDTADLIVVVIDAGSGRNEEDRRVAKQALKSKKPVILVVNKIDTVKEFDRTSAAKLGIKTILTTCATQNTGIEDMLEAIAAQIPKKQAPKREDVLTMTLIGRPNAGKSHLFNSLAQKQQAVVADVAGTTRDVNRVSVQYHGNTHELLDTAGIRRPGKIGVGIEKFSLLRTLWAIRESDVCFLLMDSNEHSTKLDQRIAGMIKDSGKGLVIVMSKWDSVEKDPYTADHMASQVVRNFPFIPWAPLIFTSSVTGQNVTKLHDMAREVHEARGVEIQTSRLNKFLQKQVAKHPPSGLKNTHPKLRYMTQTGTHPPTFTVFGTDMEFLHWSYKRYLDREIRQEFGFAGTPIQFEFKNNDTKNPYSDKAANQPRK